jgi:hypothetical protein
MTTGRKPADLQMLGGKSNRQRIWEALRKRRDGVSVYDLARAAEVDDGTVLTFLRCLIAGDYVLRHGKSYSTATYTLKKDVGAEAPRLNRDGTLNTQGQGVEAMWRSLRILGELDAADLAVSAGASGVEVSLNTARSYLAWLTKAGYVRQIGTSYRGAHGGLNRYRLCPQHNTGPLPPMIQRVGQVFDPNLGKVVFVATAEVAE